MDPTLVKSPVCVPDGYLSGVVYNPSFVGLP